VAGLDLLQACRSTRTGQRSDRPGPVGWFGSAPSRAHPDDEALLTSGILAGAAAVGHRVVIVVATDGHVTAVSDAAPARLGELRASAAVLGVYRVEHLGYADSGHGAILYPDPPDRRRFVRAGTEEAAGRLAALLRQEHADVLLS
jgi:LmbE family N-acetylglucosaminyl deacetylase